MTIVTRLSFPEGGTEYPPEENTVSSPIISSSSSNSNNCSKVRANTSSKITENKRNIGNIKRIQLRNQKPDSGKLLCIPKESSDSKQIINTANEMEGEICGSSCKAEKNDDLKKSSKVKGNNESSKDDAAASRKSMRLRLRRGRTDNNGDDIFTPKERPRYVEDLKEIDFDDENVKKMFMDALGMSPRRKQFKLDVLPPFLNENDSNLNVTTVDKITEEISSESDFIPASNEESNEKYTIGNPEEISCNSIDENTSPPQTATIASTSPILSATPPHVLLVRCIGDPALSDDEGGWESWMKKIPIVHTCNQKSSENYLPPSRTEINESLTRLIKLGTEVKAAVTGIC